MNDIYKAQCTLLLRILPIINRIDSFALKGGTALNFFVRNLPRLSVDIDLVYTKINERMESLQEISLELQKVKMYILQILPNANIIEKKVEGFAISLIINEGNATVKIEVNHVIRGTVFPVTEYFLCEKARSIFNLSFKNKILQKEELYAGKICAALDRQHPRDIFDIKLFFENEEFNLDLKRAFIIYLISHPRPISELLQPNLLDFSAQYHKEFLGMTNEVVELSTLQETRKKLIQTINDSLDDNDKAFILSYKSTAPDWNLLGLQNIENLPSIKWKLLNLRKMDKTKHSLALNKLKAVLNV